MTKPTIKWRTEWSNGRPTYIVALAAFSSEQRGEIERIADDEGFVRQNERWLPTEGAKISSLFESFKAAGFGFDFGPYDKNVQFDLQRLHLTRGTRERLERMNTFRLDELAGYCPVQAKGEFDALHFYFRARGSHWRFEAGGNASGTDAARWWFEEHWPNSTGFDAGYMEDEDAIRCILKAVERYRTEDRSRFEPGHPDYERTTLEGWSIRALTLRSATDRLGITGEEAIKRTTAHGFEVPYLADREAKDLLSRPSAKNSFDDIEERGGELPGEDR